MIAKKRHGRRLCLDDRAISRRAVLHASSLQVQIRHKDFQLDTVITKQDRPGRSGRAFAVGVCGLGQASSLCVVDEFL